MIDFIVKYWVEVLFGLISGVIAFVVRHHVKLIITDRKRHEADLLDSIDKKFEKQNDYMTNQIKECYSNLTNVVKNLEESSLFIENLAIDKYTEQIFILFQMEILA